jgi:dTDP-4-amino-4,6-dideoxygalactose transaminase
MKKYKFQYGGALIGRAEKNAINKVVDSNYWPAGKEVAKMEKEAAKYLGVNYGVLANSGSSAGLLALCALELPKGSEVIIPATTFPTIFNIILQCGLVHVVVDSKVGTYNLDPAELEQSITENTKAIICVHAVGNPCDMPKVMEIAAKHNLYVIEDNCDGWGGVLAGKKVGSFGHISFTSFHAAHIVAMGQGGGVFTNDRELARRVRMYRDWGRQSDIKERTNNDKWPQLPKDYDARFIYEKIGYNLSPLELQAAMGRVQLKKTEMIKRKRARNFKYLYENLKKHEQLIMPIWVDGADPSWFSFPLTVTTERGPLVAYLEKKGIETRSLFSGNILRHPAYANVEYALRTDLKDADYITEHSFWVTTHPRYTTKDLKYIVDVFDTYFKRHA